MKIKKGKSSYKFKYKICSVEHFSLEYKNKVSYMLQQVSRRYMDVQKIVSGEPKIFCIINDTIFLNPVPDRDFKSVLYLTKLVKY